MDHPRFGSTTLPIGEITVDRPISYADTGFDDVRQGMNEIEFLADPSHGELRVGAAEPMFGGLLPAIVERIHRKHPKISIEVRPLGALAQIHRDLRERSVDLILSRMSRSPEEDLDYEVLFHDRTLVVAGLNNPWAHRRKIKLAEITDQLWSLSPPDTVIGMLIDEAFRANGMDTPRRSVMTSSIQAHGALAGSGRYLTIFPSSALHFAGKQLALKILPVDLGIPPWPIAITTLKNRTNSPVAQLFVEYAREVAKPLATRS